MKCDGYAPPKPKAPKARKSSKRRSPSSDAESSASSSLLSMQTVDQLPLLTDPEKVYLQHFLHFTSKQLSASSAAKNFWLQYALPMSYHYDAIRYSMIAVGASHRAYMAHSLGYSRPDHLQRPVIQHYNRAISSILPIMSAPSDYNIHCILICCLLFMTCEGLTGRYDELLKHLASGDTILQSVGYSGFPEDSGVMERLIDMFCQMGLESCGFMGDHPLPGMKKWCRKDPAYRANDKSEFESPDEASFALHQLRLHHDFAPWNPDREDGLDNDNAFEDLLGQWSSNFTALSERQIETPASLGMTAHLNNLRLRQEYLQMYIDVYDNEERKPLKPYDRFIEAAEQVAAPLIALGQPTFSLDGCLVSGLSFVAVSAAEDEDIKSRALDLLQKLDHREGIFDSNDIVEMHRLIAIDTIEWDSGSDSDSDSDSGVEEFDPPLRAPVGIPAMIEVLTRKTGTTSERLEGLYS
ncbi:hypothetical protein F53441_11513 [Fusarium austroafricanum]|uniref:Uncharacterized protein n=1 Tax=Fusarium austroafricanum TaxID=2364996 RepID=A0A8H4NLZ3_9HYPO|nr:hypothetical protein F53441_11513 [Fusarium austroafricanum]